MQIPGSPWRPQISDGIQDLSDKNSSEVSEPFTQWHKMDCTRESCLLIDTPWHMRIYKSIFSNFPKSTGWSWEWYKHWLMTLWSLKQRDDAKVWRQILFSFTSTPFLPRSWPSAKREQSLDLKDNWLCAIVFGSEAGLFLINTAFRMRTITLFMIGSYTIPTIHFPFNFPFNTTDNMYLFYLSVKFLYFCSQVKKKIPENPKY